MDSAHKRTIGILGGTGPAATAHAFSRLISLCQTKHDAVQDTDFPNIVVASIPLTQIDEHGFDGSPETSQQITKELQQAATQLKDAGVELVYVACNTLHLYKTAVTSTGLQLFNLIEESTKYIAKQYGLPRVAVLGSDTTRREDLYKKALTKRKIPCITISNEQQKITDKLVLAAMGGTDLTKNKRRLKKLVNELLTESDYVVLGCTELSLLANQQAIESDRVIDSQEIALEELLRRV